MSVVSHLVDAGQAEAAVLAIVGGPGYSPPSLPRGFFVPGGQVETGGARLAAELGDSHLGLEHAFLAMIRQRDTVPARALAGLADLDAIEAAVLEAMNAPPDQVPADAVFLPDGQKMEAPLPQAIVDALPEGTTFGFNYDAGGRTWVQVLGPDGSLGSAVTWDVLNAALTSLGRPALDG